MTAFYAIIASALALVLFAAGVLCLIFTHPIWSVPCFMLSGVASAFAWVWLTLWSLENRR